MKLELKHLAAYLPYGLEIQVDTTFWHEKREAFLAVLIGIFDFETLTVKYVDEYDTTYSSNIGDFKPILRPISDLTKQIEVNEEKVIIARELVKISDGWISDDENFNQWVYNYFNDISIYPKYIHDLITECLLKNHFDVFELIKDGLAVDVNSFNVD